MAPGPVFSACAVLWGAAAAAAAKTDKARLHSIGLKGLAQLTALLPCLGPDMLVFQRQGVSCCLKRHRKEWADHPSEIVVLEAQREGFAVAGRAVGGALAVTDGLVLGKRLEARKGPSGRLLFICCS